MLGGIKNAQRVAKKVGGLLDDEFQARMAALRERNAAKEASKAKEAPPVAEQPVYLLDEAGDAPPDSVVLRGYHYGNRPGLRVLSGRMYGTGARGQESERVGAATDPRIKQRVYFYGEQGGMIPRAEPVVMGPHLYSSDLRGLYVPGRSDPEVLKRARSEGQFDANEFERMLLDYGYGGYFNPDYNQAVILGRDVPVQYLGTRNDLKDRIKR